MAVADIQWTDGRVEELVGLKTIGAADKLACVEFNSHLGTEKKC